MLHSLLDASGGRVAVLSVHSSRCTALGGLLWVLLGDSRINLGHVHHQVLDTHRVAPLVVVPERRQIRQDLY